MGQTSSRIPAVAAPDEHKGKGAEETKATTNTARHAQPSTGSSPLNRIPDDVIKAHLTPYLTNKDMGLFAAASKQSRAYFHDELTRRGTQKLLEHVVKGEESSAQAMLNANPALLLEASGETVDYSGKRITGLTAFQVALCAGDIDMVKMMRPFFAKLDDGDEQMAQQIQALFPEGFDAHLAHQLDTAFDFRQVFNAISKASDDDIAEALNLTGAEFKQGEAARSKADHDLTLIEAMNRFRENFAEKSLSEQKYNPQHLLKALELYSLTFEPANRAIWNWDKRDLFWRQIVGFCQRFIPACTAQAFAQGLYYLVKVPNYQPNTWKAEHFNRSLKFRYGALSIYPITSSCSGLGFNFAALAGWRGLHGCCELDGGVGRVAGAAPFSKNLFQSSQQVFAQLYQEASPRHGMHALNNAR